MDQAKDPEDSEETSEAYFSCRGGCTPDSTPGDTPSTGGSTALHPLWDQQTSSSMSVASCEIDELAERNIIEVGVPYPSEEMGSTAAHYGSRDVDLLLNYGPGRRAELERMLRDEEKLRDHLVGPLKIVGYLGDEQRILDDEYQTLDFLIDATGLTGFTATIRMTGHPEIFVGRSFGEATWLYNTEWCAKEPRPSVTLIENSNVSPLPRQVTPAAPAGSQNSHVMVVKAVEAEKSQATPSRKRKRGTHDADEHRRNAQSTKMSEREHWRDAVLLRLTAEGPEGNSTPGESALCYVQSPWRSKHEQIFPVMAVVFCRLDGFYPFPLDVQELLRIRESRMAAFICTISFWHNLHDPSFCPWRYPLTIHAYHGSDMYVLDSESRFHSFLARQTRQVAREVRFG